MPDIGFDAQVGAITRAAIPALAGAAKPAADSGFGKVLTEALDKVNASQAQADAMQNAFQMGDPKTTLEETMIATATANVAFQTAVQVRNRLISAYHDIMNMQV